MRSNNNSADKNSGKLVEKISSEEEVEGTELNELAKKVTQLKTHLRISHQVVSNITEQFNQCYEEAVNNIALVGGSDDDVAKMWGYNFGAFLYHYLDKRDTLGGRQALSFIKMQLGHELNTRIGGSEIQYASFVLGLSLRFMRGFETLKKNIVEIEDAMNKFEKNHTNDVKRDKTTLFGKKR